MKEFKEGMKVRFNTGSTGIAGTGVLSEKTTDELAWRINIEKAEYIDGAKCGLRFIVREPEFIHPITAEEQAAESQAKWAKGGVVEGPTEVTSLACDITVSAIDARQVVEHLKKNRDKVTEAMGWLGRAAAKLKAFARQAKGQYSMPAILAGTRGAAEYFAHRRRVLPKMPENKYSSARAFAKMASLPSHVCSICRADTRGEAHADECMSGEAICMREEIKYVERRAVDADPAVKARLTRAGALSDLAETVYVHPGFKGDVRRIWERNQKADGMEYVTLRGYHVSS